MRREGLGRLTDVKVFVFVICLALFLASLWAFALAFHVPGYELPIFLAGILGVALSFGIPFNLMRGSKSES